MRDAARSTVDSRPRLGGGHAAGMHDKARMKDLSERSGRASAAQAEKGRKGSLPTH